MRYEEISATSYILQALHIHLVLPLQLKACLWAVTAAWMKPLIHITGWDVKCPVSNDLDFLLHQGGMCSQLDICSSLRTLQVGVGCADIRI